MKALVIYDSVFGNTKEIANAIAKGVKQKMDVESIHVQQVNKNHLAGLDLLIVGSPTRQFSATGAINSFLQTLDRKSLQGTSSTAFDTRIDVAMVDVKILLLFVKLFGYAAEPIAKKLVRKGGTQLLPAEGFIVNDTEGPLRDGEMQRAEQWGKQAAGLVHNIS